MSAFPKLRNLRATPLPLFVFAILLALPIPVSAAEEESAAEPLPPTRLELWIKDGDGPTTEKASIPLVEAGTFAVRFVIDGREIPGVEHLGQPVRLRWQLEVGGEVAPSEEPGADYAVVVRPILHTVVDGEENLATMRMSWEKVLDVTGGEVVEIEIPTSPGSSVIIPAERMAWEQLPRGVEVVHEGEGLALRLGELNGARELSLVLRLGPEG